MINIPIGIDSFCELRKLHCYYVDKTFFLQEFFETVPAKVSLLTRPRRFGKTLLLSMLEAFFDIRKNSEELFSDLSIYENKDICNEYMNKYPVINLTLKEIEGESFDEVLDGFSEKIGNICIEHSYILHPCSNKAKVDEDDKETFKVLKSKQGRKTTVKNSLLTLSRILGMYYNKPVIILIDEYDAPLNSAWGRGHYEETIDFMRCFFGSAVKSNPFLKFVILTGCIRIAKESIFTGVNNFKCYSILNNSFSDSIGFTELEIEKLLHDTGFINKKSDIKQWYDGYCFGNNTGVYCPWDVLNYIMSLQKNPGAEPETYWINTSSNHILKSILKYNKAYGKKAFEILLNGSYVKGDISEFITYEDLYSSPTNILTILYLTGYLTCLNKTMQSDIKLDYGEKALVIPNKEIREIFVKSVQSWFSENIVKDDRSTFIDAFRKGDQEVFNQELSKFILKTISFYDYHERFYHGYLLGLFTGLDFWIESNREDGDGRSDITIEDGENKIISIIEIKYLRSYRKRSGSNEEIVIEDCKDDSCYSNNISFMTKEKNIDEIRRLLSLLSIKALKQIEEKRYDAKYRNRPYFIMHWGIAFFEKISASSCTIVQR